MGGRRGQAPAGAAEVGADGQEGEAGAAGLGGDQAAVPVILARIRGVGSGGRQVGGFGLVDGLWLIVDGQAQPFMKVLDFAGEVAIAGLNGLVILFRHNLL